MFSVATVMVTKLVVSKSWFDSDFSWGSPHIIMLLPQLVPAITQTMTSKKRWETCEHSVKCMCVWWKMWLMEQLRKVDVFSCLQIFLPLLWMGLSSVVGQCFYHLKGHRAKSFCPAVFREPCVLQAVFCGSKHCGNDREWKTLLPTRSVGCSTLAVNIPPHAHKCKNQKVAGKLWIFEPWLCNKYECYDRVELMWESPHLCECFTVWMGIRMRVENEWVRPSVIAAIRLSFEENTIFSKLLMGFERWIQPWV